MQRINIYYGGRGLIEDPTIYVMNKLTEVFKELNIEVKKYNLYEDKRGISVLPKTLKEADGVILAASVEWLGIGGLLQQFLDACWLYGDKDKIGRLYMLPVVTATTAGEKDAYHTLVHAWEILGGIPCEGVCAYVENYADFETDPDYAWLVEQKAEDFYRSFSKKRKTFPSSTNAICEKTLQPKTMHLTPQESEQLSMYVSDVKYVQKQKEDIEELTSMFKGLLGDEDTKTSSGESAVSGADPYVAALTKHFTPMSPLQVSYTLQFQDTGRVLTVAVQDDHLSCSAQDNPAADVRIRLSDKVMEQIIRGETTMHNAFLAGNIAAKGDFKQLRTFDGLFPFLAKQQET
jgi:multimeric flavodoxin WrbA/putative sterol carrier protein